MKDEKTEVMDSNRFITLIEDTKVYENDVEFRHGMRNLVKNKDFRLLMRLALLKAQNSSTVLGLDPEGENLAVLVTQKQEGFNALLQLIEFLIDKADYTNANT